VRRRRRLPLRLHTADLRRRRPKGHRGALSWRRWRISSLRGLVGRAKFNPRPRASRRAVPSRPPRAPRIRPRRSVVERVLPTGEPAPPRTLVRLRVLGVVVVMLFSLMLVRLWYLQVLDQASYSAAVNQNQVRPVEIPAPRGLIVGRDGTILVGNDVSRDITLSRLAAQQHPAVVGTLAALLGISPQQIQAKLADPRYSLYAPVPILPNAPMDDVLAVGEHQAELPGVSAVAETQRTYPQGQTGVQMLGYVGQISASELAARRSQGYQLGDQMGQSGLEYQYEGLLRGQPGVDRVEVDAKGQVVGSLGTTPPVAGDDLITNIDPGLEQTLQQALDAQLQALRGTVDPSTGQVVSAPGGAAVALDPRTGAVLALVSAPTYDPSWWVGGISQAHYSALENDPGHPLLDRAIDGVYTPGSTFKLATATAALADGLITPSYTYDDTGSYTIPGCAAGGAGCAVYHDNDGEAGGVINITRALSISSDVFFYNLGVMFWEQRGHYGPTPIQDVANAYSYGEPTGIDLPGESTYPRVDSPAVRQKLHAEAPKAFPNAGWYTGDNLELAFGQGGTVITPIEQAVAFATFANGGTRYAPQIAAGAVSPDGTVVKRFAPKVVGHVPLSPQDHQAMLQGFIGAVQSPGGTASSAFAGFPFSQMSVAGKTGTASGASGSVPTAWFVGFAPANDPQYVIAVAVEHGGYGATAAAPVARAGFQYLLQHPVQPVVLAVPPAPGQCQAPGSSSGPATTTTTTGAGETGTGPTPPAAGGGVPASCPPPAAQGTPNAAQGAAQHTAGGVGGAGAGPPGQQALQTDRPRAPPRAL